MERREPTFVPEWLKSNGTATGGGNSAHNFASSSSHSEFSSGHHGRHRNSRNVNDFDSHRSAFLDRSSSLNSRRSSSNGWENGVSSPTQKYVVSPTSVNSRVTISQHAVGPARNSNSPILSAGGQKVAALNSVAGFTVEKRPSAQTQSRNDFFNLLKKKTSAKTSADHSDSHPHISSSTSEKSEVTEEVVSTSLTSHANENGTAATRNGDACQEAQRFADVGVKDMGPVYMIDPDEEEAAFLRSLGWEENSGEDEGLTEEEINAFYQEYMELRPTLKLCRGMQPKLAESFATNLDGAASELSSSDSGSEA
ncbi:hypothetical protein V6N12_034431 [Hibiscus sabdariffa]|uniref:Uncharacterized protein n=1 Tax=Hibiscus sabdariffa TaxID=183260 RepID=A0ABR2DH73_9ROSI